QAKLFFVGDYKQSIYRFRGADPSVFLRMQSQTPRRGRLPLTKNFRSQPAILHFVNALFCEALSGNSKSVDGGPQPRVQPDHSLESQPLESKRDQVSATPAVEFLWAKVDGVKNEAGAKKIARQQEAERIARRIRSMLDKQEKIVVEKDSDGHLSARLPKFK